MAKRPNHVPKFGNWDPNDYLPYTKVFDHARATKGVSIINPNDPAQLQTQADMEDRVQRLHTQPRGRTSRGDTEPISMKSPGRKSAAPSIKPGDIPGGATSVGRNQEDGMSERVIGKSSYAHPDPEVSPVHPQAHPGRSGKRLGSASPAIVRKAEAGSFAPGTPTRNRTDRTALPKFGDWDVNNPAASEGFTMIFNKARHEKKTGGSLHISLIQADSPLRQEANVHKGQRVTQQASNCFWWCFQPSAAK